MWRLASMTKPITSVAAMMLYEEGAFELKDPVSGGSRRSGTSASTRRFGPATGDGARDRADAGLAPAHPHGRAHLRLPPRPPGRRPLPGGRFEWGTPPRRGPGAGLRPVGRLPLLFEPGTEWNYSVATDVLGRLVEVVSGQPLDEFFADRIFDPLGMTDTGFWADPAAQPRLAAVYMRGAGRHGGQARRPRRGRAHAAARALRGRRSGVHRRRLPAVHPDAAAGQSGRTGRRPAAEPAHGRLHDPQPPAGRRRPGDLRPAAVRRDHLRRGRLRPGLLRGPDPGPGKVLGSAGEFGWGGAASTAFWVDQEADLTVLFFTQLLPSSTHPIRSQLNSWCTRP